METALYGRGQVVFFHWDVNLGWVYTLRIPAYVCGDESIRLVESALAEIPAVVLLGELACD